MLAYVYRPRRRDADGKVEVSRLYRARIRLQGEFKITELPLQTTDRQVAERKLAELVSERERERAGLIAPRIERDSAQQTLIKHQDDFAADLTALGRTEKYVLLTKARLSRLAKGCGWKLPADISANSFVAWRAEQEKLSPKTLNEYLNSANALLNWMVKQGRTSVNPLKNVTYADVRGRQQRRRAFTNEELDRLLAVSSPSIRLLYLAAAFTGLRVGELRQVAWADLHLDHARPHIVVRASTTKNRKEATLPLHPQLLKELLAIRTPETKPEARVFSQHPHPDRRIRIDMAAAGIARIDAMGRKLDFHALRYTFATKLASSGVSQRLAQELLRHSDPRLTANIYTDATLLPTFEAVSALAWQKEATPLPPQHTAIAPLSSDFDGHKGAHPVTVMKVAQPARNADKQGFGQVLAQFAKGEKIIGATGFEGQDNPTQIVDNQSTEQNPSATNTAIAPLESEAIAEEMVEVAGVEPASP